MATAELNLGLLYAEGRGGVRRDEAEAVAWYRKAAAQKQPLAQLLLGVAYATGRGVPRDDQQAFNWFEQAASSGLPLAQYGLGMMYNEGRGSDRMKSMPICGWIWRFPPVMWARPDRWIPSPVS